MSEKTYRVTAQYQSAGERVYEVESADTKLEIRISSQSAGKGERTWHVAVLPGAAADGVVFTDSGETKQSALTKAAALWSQEEAELGLAHVDWQAVAGALLAVRGI